MTTQNPQSYHYNYQQLDDFLKKDAPSPKEIAQRLDQIQGKLVALVSHDEQYSHEVFDDHWLLGIFKGIFNGLEKTQSPIK